MRTACVSACTEVTGQCVALGGGRAHCRRYWIRQCRHGGVGACALPRPTTSSSSTTTTSSSSTTTTMPTRLGASYPGLNLFCDDGNGISCGCTADHSKPIVGVLVLDGVQDVQGVLMLDTNVLGGPMRVEVSGALNVLDIAGIDFDGYSVRGTSCIPGTFCCVAASVQIGLPTLQQTVGLVNVARRGCAPIPDCDDWLGVDYTGPLIAEALALIAAKMSSQDEWVKG